jgi:hypothetical protein
MNISNTYSNVNSLKQLAINKVVDNKLSNSLQFSTEILPESLKDEISVAIKQRKLAHAIYEGDFDKLEELYKKPPELAAEQVKEIKELYRQQETSNKLFNNVFNQIKANPLTCYYHFRYLNELYNEITSRNVQIRSEHIEKALKNYMHEWQGDSLKAAVTYGCIDGVRYHFDKGKINYNAFLHLAVKYGHLDIVKLLVKNGADVNLKNSEGSTPLHIVGGDDEAVRVAEFLIENGANINLKNEYGNTPLHNAVAYWRIKTVILFVLNGADINLKDRHGNTALHLAVATGYSAMVKFLADNMPNMNLKNRDGQTALDIAIKRRYTDIVEILNSVVPEQTETEEEKPTSCQIS